MKLSFVYLTNRIEPKIEWFFASLASQLLPDDDFEVIVVDFHKGRRSLPSPPSSWHLHYGRYRHVAPKPSVWQGEHRLTGKDYFAASNARNTGLCLASGEYICYVDDLSVLMPGYMVAVREAMRHQRITLGAYRKVLELAVGDDGLVTHHKDNPSGRDTRHGGDGPVPCQCRWHYGCSIVAPIEHYLSINGWPEDLCDGTGYEDIVCGLALRNSGFQFQYDTRMMTWESDELHSQNPTMMREDPCKGSPNARRRDDMSHAMLGNAETMKRFENSFGTRGIRGEREDALAGKPFPVRNHPQHRWFDGKPLSEL